MLLVVNMLWKLHRTSHPDEEKKNMIEDETNYSNQNSKMTSTQFETTFLWQMHTYIKNIT